ncbi:MULTISPECIES: PepSY domain-containing protein [unclassified Coleofasciculus]|uniref:PepSY domain-containing protein n=1 Tax=unclassified Coleofasciculus TaxID=2692782 RepID=UPI0018822B85|nr:MULTISPECIES: PepSY domain-containing protein [unclassified Coleofasciculus]MBE9125583.1 PepSY domain-containing protein [Coleofasciculus sp. LEGE 07081]MBE9147297.1 PepSY domain-containing protein [Coleofasciculus sp. LEGE 07092]
MNRSTQWILATAILGTLGLGGLVRTVYATQSKPAVATITQHHTNTQIAEASDGDGEVPDDVEEQQEAARLQPLAKITPQQAKQAAEAAQGGTASRVTLDNEDGNLVYTAIIGQTEVAVDAGNGKVLYTENMNQEDDANEATRPRSSIQVPYTDAEDDNDANGDR